jgi:hypothetical protein
LNPERSSVSRLFRIDPEFLVFLQLTQNFLPN